MKGPGTRFFIARYAESDKDTYSEACFIEEKRSELDLPNFKSFKPQSRFMAFLLSIRQPIPYRVSVG